MEQEYQEYINLPYFKVHKAPTYEEWLKIRNRQPLFVQDLRSEYLKQLAKERKSQEQTSELLYKNQHLWNHMIGSNIRINKNNAKQMFDFSKDVTKSNINAGMLISGIGELKSLYNLAKLSPYGMLNLGVNLALQGAVGIGSSYLGNLLEQKTIGTNGVIGSTLFGLGALYGFNKIPFMRDFNKAISRPYASSNLVDEYILSKGGTKAGYKQEGDMTIWFDDYNPGDPTLAFVEGPNHQNLLLRFSERPSAEMHLGGNGKAPDKEAIMWSARMALGLPSGTYVSPYGNAMSRILRIQNLGIISLKPKPKSFIPATTDGYATAIKIGNNKNMGFDLDFAENYYMNGFHNEIEKTTNPLLRLLYDAFKTNPNKETLNAFNKYLVELGGKPALYINGELKIPLPVLFKK